MWCLDVHYLFVTVATPKRMTFVCFTSLQVNATAWLAVLKSIKRCLPVCLFHYFVLPETKIRSAYAFAITAFYSFGRVSVTGVCKTYIASEFTAMTQDCLICFVTLITHICWARRILPGFLSNNSDYPVSITRQYVCWSHHVFCNTPDVCDRLCDGILWFLLLSPF